MDEQGIHVINCDEGKEKMMLMNVNITAFSFSPKCNYLLTCEKFGQSTMKNLTFWEIDSGNEVAHFEWRKFPKDITKLVQFTKNEEFCAKLAGRNIIEVFKGKDFKN